MAEISGYTKDFVDGVIASLIEAAEVNGDGDLIFTRHDASEFNAGSVIGPTGPAGPASVDIQVGDIIMSMRPSKTGFLPVTGGTYNDVDYPALAAFLDQPGSTFTLPDWRNRGPLGAGGSIAPNVNSQGGAATHTLTTAELPDMSGNTGNESNGHIHGGGNETGDDDPVHNHQVPGPSGLQFVIGPVAGASTLWLNTGALADHGSADVTFVADAVTGDPSSPHQHVDPNTTGASAGHTHPFTIDNGGGAHNNLQPYFGINYFIKY